MVSILGRSAGEYEGKSWDHGQLSDKVDGEHQSAEVRRRKKDCQILGRRREKPP
jgi:hypothetical protein